MAVMTTIQVAIGGAHHNTEPFKEEAAARCGAVG